MSHQLPHPTVMRFGSGPRDRYDNLRMNLMGDATEAAGPEQRPATAPVLRRLPTPLQKASKPARLFTGSYTFGHGRRQVRLGPVAFWTIVGTLVVMGCWTVITATYFAFEEDVLTRLLARQAEMQFTYEDRIADMRAQVDRVTSRQLLDQEQFEKKLETLIRRQTTLESRATTLGTLGDPNVTGSVKSTGRTEIAPGPAKPTPVTNDRGAALEPSRLSATISRIASRITGGGIAGTLGRVQESLDRVEARQTAALAGIEENLDAKAKRLRGVLSELGVDVGKPANDATGGPFVPLKPPNDAIPFENRLQRVSLMRAHVDRLSKTLSNVPLRKPVAGEIDLSSGFGVRVDPFLGRPAMHTGLDFRGDAGEPVYATAAGTVTSAGSSGGYGRMVEIEHSNAFSTRYGHLSEIIVRVGQVVKVGQIVGKIGSTGRSTGPHLHYETRNDGDAVDPQKFLRAGTKLGLIN